MLAAPSSQMTSASQSQPQQPMIPHSALRLTDVLLGRGRPIQNHPGNVHLRSVVVAARKDEYVAAKTHAAKDRLAREVMHCVLDGSWMSGSTARSTTTGSNGDGGADTSPAAKVGRFLRQATAAETSQSGANPAASPCWTAADESAILIKLKQMLRQDRPRQPAAGKKKGRDNSNKRCSDASATAAAAAPCAANGGGTSTSCAENGTSATRTTDGTGTASGRPNAATAAAGSQDTASATATRIGIGGLANPTVPPSVSFGAEASAEAASEMVTAGPAAATIMTDEEFLNGSLGSLDGSIDDDSLRAEGDHQKKVAAAVTAGSPATQPNLVTNNVVGTERKGRTIREWVHAEMIRSMSLHGSRVDEADRSYQQKAAALSLALLRVVALYHGNSITFGGDAIGTDTILVYSGGDGGNSEHSYRIEFAEVGSQSPPLQSTSTADMADRVRADLRNAGAVLYEIFSGVAPFQSEESDALIASLTAAGPSAKKKRGRMAPTDVTPLRDLGLPTAVDAMVMDMLHTKNMSAIESDDAIRKAAADYTSIVQLMVQNPQRYMFDLDDDPLSSASVDEDGKRRLVFPKDRLYGREEQSALLAAIFARVICKGGNELITVSGYSGIGKTSLVQQLRQPTLDRGGFFIEGKFDALRQARPLSAIVMALDSYCDDLMSRQADSNFDQIRSSIQKVVGEGGTLLRKLVPNLRRVLSADTVTDQVGQSAHDTDHYAEADAETVDSQALNRLIHCFRKLFDAIAAPAHPVVLFLDDLQWADDLSLGLIKAVLSEGNNKALLFVGCYRSNEVEQGHSLLSHLDGIRSAAVPVHNIALESMNKDSINALISDMLKLSPLITQPLAEAIHSKTSGNCLFVVELLADLERQDLLRFSLSSRRWEWDTNAINALGIHTNVVDLMRRKLIRLGAIESLVIKIAACLGAHTESSTLNVLSRGLGLQEENSLSMILQHTVDEGLMYRAGTSFRFSHDQIQQAAYSLINVGERPSLHMKIGRSLEPSIALGATEDILFTCVDQLNRGSAVMNSRPEKTNLALLNLKAGKAAMSSSTFLTAAVYLRMAFALLDADAWESDYDLCLEVHNCLTETEYATGKYEEMAVILNVILDRAHAYEHKLRAYYTLMSANAAQNDLKAAVSIGFEVLEQLGEKFETNSNQQLILSELSFTKGMLVSKDRQWFEAQSIMVDHDKLYAMKFLYALALYVYMTDGMKMPFLSCRLVQLSIEHGLCEQSAFGFAAYGICLCGVLGEHEEAYKAGKIAWVIMDKFQARDSLARCVVACGMINSWIEPLQSVPPQLVEAYNAMLSSGDPEYALLALRNSCTLSFHSGRSLSDVAEGSSMLSRDANVYQIQLMSEVNKALWQGTMNLMDHCSSADPTILSGEVMPMQEDDYVARLLEKKNMFGVCYAFQMKQTLACIFGRFDLAMVMYGKCMEHDLPKNLLGQFVTCTCIFYGGLAALIMRRAQPERSHEYIDTISNAIAKVERWASVSSWNCGHKLALLQAENQWTSGDLEGAARAYEKATRLAMEHRFLNDEGLARERYGAFLSSDEVGDERSSRRQYDLAYEAYAKWGARRKCLDLKVQGYTDGRQRW